ncbi:MAG: ribosome biogenesis/translation initiation ATPase RLI [Candidatus Aenigmarchaeota archaeon]|nr:ribosome biogenesis/translation initiation ATPase RLI [Candidatus Aenigmarchaeota archaeon]
MTRIASVNRELCKKDKCGYLCKKVCPINRTGEDCILVDEKTGFPIIDEELCIGCGLCVSKCDKAGYKAVHVVNLPEKLKEIPIHRFGKNQFILFRLPFPTPGRIVGLVGSNGLGKTTALEILSGQLKPNLGEEKKAETSEVVKMFRGTELQNYLEKLEGKEMRVSYKLQRVDKIPFTFKGKVSKLLEKTDERGILNDLIQRFDIERILSNDIDKISGGELQRVAITACLAKDSDIYYFDEPTSFLDVFQRLEVSKTIQEFCEDRSVIVVDHDLATLDFLADNIHIFYGLPGVYGIVSSPYSVRVGINAFLDGYIKEDNVRIRPKSIHFESTFIEQKGGIEQIVEFQDIKKKLGNFELTVKRGKIYRREVLGILGANALGKTTFAKILAGEIKQDQGKIHGKVKISYKPQYPRTDFDGTIRELLKSVANEFESSDYKSRILRPLGLDKLLEKNVNKLSGGELQRVAVAVSLSKESDIYLLDEPSAFMDVEQRLNLAKLVRNLVEKQDTSALIVDHDLLFLSQISDRAMVFLGKPGIEGYTEEPETVKSAFNKFLKEVDVTFRRDPQTGRPRANKLESQMDQQQKNKGKYFMG